jgi:hypothetical protein
VQLNAFLKNAHTHASSGAELLEQALPSLMAAANALIAKVSKLGLQKC